MISRRSVKAVQLLLLGCLFSTLAAGRSLLQAEEDAEQCYWSEGLERCAASPKLVKEVLKEMAEGVSDDVIDWLACQVQQTQEGCEALGCSWFSATCSVASLPDPSNVEFLKKCYGNAAAFLDSASQSRNCKSDYTTKDACKETSVCDWKDGECKFDIFKAVGSSSRFFSIFTVGDKTVRDLLSKTLSCNLQATGFFCRRKQGCSWDKEEKDCGIDASFVIKKILKGSDQSDDPQCEIVKIALESECRTKLGEKACEKSSNCVWKPAEGVCDTDKSFIAKAAFSGYDNFSEALKKKDAACQKKTDPETCEA